MTPVRTVSTADLSGPERSAVRGLLDLAFGGAFTAEDWDHALGGLHFLVLGGGGEPIAHASVVPRRFLLDDRPLRCGYVEAVAVHPAHRRQGLGGAVMAPAERAIDHGYDLGALSASEDGHGLYLSRGWRLWDGPTAVLAPSGVTLTPEDDDSTFVRGITATGTLVCDWRAGDVW
ncbi:aminoglycoside 2'-N-acetyltransferase I [Actinoplanes lutulentus]|uniref:Aminoglycoside 2'-N-acetyltransferase I n=1 Tax=Actinoplanes lutulentus TaxID=1287878 RepID=A0A327Z4F0_9ACTN|nr:GNAT family N-acetyltransferase [Actinoplanes lutulentus]MBB2943838.1 aminoglycoside 2'-N-acetyltransferase I [Actinoplanes lutulentus]RAK29380.1 aminoglycoside 2'-N-acetyltransferase I [Actinoplanes lutulentus]